MSGYLEKSAEEFEEKKEQLEEKWLQKVQLLSEERDYIYEMFSKYFFFRKIKISLKRTCQKIKNEKFSNNVSKILSLKSEILTQEMEVKVREKEYFSLENSLKKALAEKNMKPEHIIINRAELEKKKSNLIFLKKS